MDAWDLRGQDKLKKKILIVTYWYPSDAMPIHGVFIEEQALALSRTHDVAVLIPGLGAWRNFLKKESAQESFDEVRQGIRVFREFALPRIPHGGESITYKALARAAENGFNRVLRDWGKPDILHAHVVLPGGWVAVQLARKHSLPVVLTEHSGPFSMHLDTEYKSDLVRETLQQADKLVAVSPFLADQITAFEPGVTVDVVGNLIRTDFFVPNAKVPNGSDPATCFLSIAHLVEGKGLKYLLEAASLLVERGAKNFEIVIGGDGPQREPLAQLVENLEIQKWCRFLGAVDRAETRRLMQACDAFVLPSLHESFGIVLGEAMACGKPVIATRCGGPEFFVDENSGCLVEPANAEALANAMAAFLEKRLSYDPSALRASVVSRFGAEAFVERLSSLYEQVQLKRIGSN